MTVAAVIFDLDGVLLDSEPVWNEARESLTRDSGGRWSPGAVRDMMGMSSPEWSRYMHDELGVPLAPDEISRDVVAGVRERYAAGLPLIDGAVEAVRRAGGPLAARAGVVGQPGDHRPRARAERARAAVRGERVVGGGGRGQAGAGRLPRGRLAARRAARRRRRGGGLHERAALGAGGGHGRDRDPEPRLPAGARGAGGGRPRAGVPARAHARWPSSGSATEPRYERRRLPARRGQHAARQRLRLGRPAPHLLEAFGEEREERYWTYLRGAALRARLRRLPRRAPALSRSRTRTRPACCRCRAT